MYLSGASELTVVYKKSYLLTSIEFFMNVFIREASIDKNIASECIRTIATTYGCKILQLCEHDTNVYRYDANCK